MDTEKEYRALFENGKDKVITLAHLFDAVRACGLQKHLDNIIGRKEPILIVLEGSSFVRNLNVLDLLIAPRNNPEDKIILIEISDMAIAQHQQHLQEVAWKKSNAKISIIKGDMNSLPFDDGTASLVINDCAINFNKTHAENIQTLGEIKRVMTSTNSLALLSVVVRQDLDDSRFGQDQELTSQDQINIPGSFSSFKTLEDGTIQIIPKTERLVWSVPYYQNLFKELGFDYVRFDQENGKTFFSNNEMRISYRRYLLTIV